MRLPSVLTPDIEDTIHQAGDKYDYYHYDDDDDEEVEEDGSVIEGDNVLDVICKTFPTCTSSWHCQFSCPAWWQRQQYLMFLT